MNLFFDTSALVKFFHNENGTRQVTALITDPQNSIWILDIASLEFRCALYRRFRNKEITEIELNQAIHYFFEQLEFFYTEPLGHGIIKEAEALLEIHGPKFGLRTLDALHLGTFQLIAEQNWHFVTADKKLAEIAVNTGAKVITPIQ